MNERIKLLAEQAGFSFKYKTAPDEMNPGHKLKDLKKFAELIVKECMNRVRSRQQFAGEDQQNVTQAFDLLVYDLESHFGVEE
jgi:hypothetical protein